MSRFITVSNAVTIPVISMLGPIVTPIEVPDNKVLKLVQLYFDVWETDVVTRKKVKLTISNFNNPNRFIDLKDVQVEIKTETKLEDDQKPADKDDENQKPADENNEQKLDDAADQKPAETAKEVKQPQADVNVADNKNYNNKNKNKGKK